MRRPSGRWWIGIAAVSFALILQSGAARAGHTEKMAEGQAAGQDAGGMVRSRFGDKDLLRRNILNPTTSSGSPLQTLDGSTSFSGQLSFPSSNKFLEVFTQPGPTGDLATVIVGEDLNFDGKTDYSFQVPFPVSGICGNGIISCAPGTWRDCRHYLWRADAGGRVSLQEDFSNQTGGCYCVNNDCGQNLAWNNVGAVLQDLGGGVVGAMQQSNPAFVVSDVKIENTTISYYGQDTSRTTKGDGTPSAPAPASPTQAAYFSNPFAIQNETQTVAAAQADDPQSLYSLITGIPSKQQRNFCEASRKIVLTEKTVNDVITPLGGTGSVQHCGPDCIDVILGRVGDNYWSGWCSVFNENFRFYVHFPELIQSATLIRAKWDDYMQIWIGGVKAWSGPNNNFPPETAGACELGTNWDQNPNKDMTQYFRKKGEVQTKIRVSVGRGGEGYAFIRVRLKGDRCISSATVSDGCASLASRSDCTLLEEKVDGVYTYRNGNPTGLTPLPSARVVTQGSCTKSFIYDWWQKARVYLCDLSSYDFSGAKTRFGRVIGSLNEDGASATYQDRMKSPGGWLSASGSLELMDLPHHDACEKACKTRRSKLDSQVALNQHSGQWKTDTTNYDILYHACVDGTCPAGPGEEILKDCQCLNEFAEAASIIQLLRLAGQDMICSDGVPKTP